MTDAYLLGFLAKCAEAGVDPQVLLQPKIGRAHV